jgi:hypothetical protein
MADALMHFQFLAASQRSETFSIVVFFTEKTKFREKIASGKGTIKEHFPHYRGSDCDPDGIQIFFAHEFRSVNRSLRNVHIHFVDGDSDNVLEKAGCSIRVLANQRNLINSLL